MSAAKTYLPYKMDLEGLFRRRRLPHWDVAGATYFITTCLAGSIPAQGLLDLERYRKELESKRRRKDLTQEAWDIRRHKLLFKRLDEWLDLRPQVRYLADERLAAQVRDSLRHFAGERYDLHAYVVMPSHFHWVFTPLPAYCDLVAESHHEHTPREQIMKSIKGFTARNCNQLLNRTGTFWQDESYDHVVRDEGELSRIVEYVVLNPVKAGLVEAADRWRYSSAFDGEAAKPSNQVQSS